MQKAIKIYEHSNIYWLTNAYKDNSNNYEFYAHSIFNTLFYFMIQVIFYESTQIGQ